MNKEPVAILGASGTVGQKMILLMEDSSEFYVKEVVGSDARIGKRVDDSLSWHQNSPFPDHLKNRLFSSIDDIQSRYVLSALPSDAAEKIEPLLAKKGHIVISNASTFRMDPKVPLIIPEINGHLLNEHFQTPGNKNRGAIITNPNCVVCILALALQPLIDFGSISHIFATTLQSASGAGYPGVPSLDIINNIVPNIPEEETKIKEELLKIFPQAHFPVSIQVNRVPVRHGHMISLHVLFSHPVTPQSVTEKIKEWSNLNNQVISVYESENAPQIQHHLSDDDMRVHIGRITQDHNERAIRMVILGHNLIRGAAGAAIINLERAAKNASS